MSKYEFSPSCFWQGQQETPREMADRCLRTLDAISRIFPHCQTWQVVDRKREAMVPLDIHRADMTALIEQGITYDDFGNPAPEYGYLLTASSAQANQKNRVSIRFHGAMKSPRMNYGSAILTTPPADLPDPAITNYPLMRAILLTLVEIWQPYFGRVFVAGLIPVQRQPSVVFDLNWMTYLSLPLARQLKPLGSIAAEVVRGGGVLLTATKQTFDVDNPEHIAAASAIQDAAAPLNARMPRPWRW